MAFNKVTFYLEDVMADRVIAARSVDDLLSGKLELLCIDQRNYIDLTTSGSMIFAGKTRSGKTTAIISLLLQVLSQEPGGYGSNVCIIDPKKAELSRLPHTYTLDENGEARLFLEVMKQTVRNIRMRQDILNDISETKGDVAHWWEAEANMHVNLLFIDEYVGLLAAFPKKPAKDDDVDENGKQVEPHVHLMMCFENSRHVNAIAKKLNDNPQQITVWKGRAEKPTLMLYLILSLLKAQMITITR